MPRCGAAKDATVRQSGGLGRVQALWAPDHTFVQRFSPHIAVCLLQTQP